MHKIHKSENSHCDNSMGSSKTIAEHICTFKSLCDNLAAIGKPVSDKEKVFYLLTSLGPQYKTFTIAMMKPPRPTYTKLVSQLQSLDQRRSWFSGNTDITSGQFSSQVAFYGQHQHYQQQSSTGYRGKSQQFTSTGHGFQAQQPRNNNKNYLDNSVPNTKQRRPPPPGERHMTPAERNLYREEKCQFCGTMGHIAKICWWLPKKSTHNEEIPQALAARTLDNTIADTEWTSDTRASNHMTGKPGMLFNIRRYSGSDSVLIADGSSLPITEIGDTNIKQNEAILPLQNVLLVPDLTKNLLSMSQLTTQFPVNCEFSDVDFRVKKREIRQMLIKGRRKGDLYVLSNSPELQFSYRFKSGSAEVWHQRLGHPQFSALQLLKDKGLIEVVGAARLDHICDSWTTLSMPPCTSPLPTIAFSTPGTQNGESFNVSFSIQSPLITQLEDVSSQIPFTNELTIQPLSNDLSPQVVNPNKVVNPNNKFKTSGESLSDQEDLESANSNQKIVQQDEKICIK
ncbi:hypothetical protein DITRI_Ditri12bG0163200 [Diplodiscus trichospermus]